MFAKIILAVPMLAALVQGHMIMNTPQPYNTPFVINSPLNADGSNFPCQLTAGQSLVAGSASNTFALGSIQPLTFIGETVHGGGSCQVSITYDPNPSKDSVWKVIQSIEGGCPARGETGNLGADDDASTPDPYTYNFTVPDNIPTGAVTLAWTWFNKVGNREMYMNCAPVTLTGTSGSKSNFESLPEMFVANVDNGCGTVDSTDLLFPNPGVDVISLNGDTSVFSTPTGTGCQQPGPSPAAASAAATPAAGGKKAATSAGYPGGVFVTSGASAPGTAKTTAAAASTQTTAAVTVSATTTITLSVATTINSPATAASTGSSSSSTSSSTSGTAETAGSACHPDGTWNCLGNSYQRCASGQWSVVLPLADGTSCTVGQGASIKITPSEKFRRVAMRFRS
ncbi:hypothetical protein SEPCBS57363_005375 [Sporothrix epigloea]|uniref:Lytic polysaccharide monooxygenase n=1 Tax=Sporothrix epigloea TaxID=1892477 RepID=A0ABP0DX75_9PEZI